MQIFALVPLKFEQLKNDDQTKAIYFLNYFLHYFSEK